MHKQERRRYFRVNSDVIFSYRALNAQEKKKRIRDFEAGEISYPDSTRLFLSLEADISDLIQTISLKDANVASALHLLNRKLNLVSRGAPMNVTQTTLMDEEPQEVNISACGIAFRAENAIAKGTDIEIEMILLPEKVYIMAYGVVVDCDQKTLPCRVNVDFVLMKEDDTERLIAHIMRKENEILKTRRKKTQ